MEVGLAELNRAPPRLKKKALPRVGDCITIALAKGPVGGGIAPAIHTMIYDFFLPQKGYIFPLRH